ncbi:SDR family NAD(P)-dependent oxidoreductase [Clostridium felsineum]|uniref:SDR family NAD(P)-dependent oxidoreductase n=1 Tax=Clostridium felsineum TaxID=36839 RepID=UPI001590C9E3|nr:3-oxoacyl-ACP reductase family protein [Clostridium felsineum]
MLNNRVVFVTGGASEIGRGISQRIAEYGAQVILSYNSSKKKAEQTQKNIIDIGGKVDIIKMNVNNEESVKEVFDYIKNKYGKLDSLINNAGIAKPICFEEVSIEEWNNHIITNLTGPFLCIKYAIDLMKKSNNGKVINISSVAALTGGSFGPHYAASKSGLIGLTKSAAKELAKYGITANVIAPGPIESYMTDSLSKESLDKIIGSTPQMRLGKITEVAEIVCQLLNPNINYINGQTIVIDGGRYMI